MALASSSISFPYNSVVMYWAFRRGIQPGPLVAERRQSLGLIAVVFQSVLRGSHQP